MTTIFGQITNRENTRPIQNIAERAPSPEEADRRMMDHLSAKIRVAIPAQVVSFNAAKQTIVAQPLIREKIIDRATGNVQWVTLPQILDVPVQFPQGGDLVMTFPLQAGDEVQLQFCDLNIDSWFTSGGIQNWNDRRRHDMSDAVAIPGIRNQQKTIQNFATDAAEIRSLNGNTKIRIENEKILLKRQGVETEVSSSQINLAFNADNFVKISAAGVEIKGVLKINNTMYLNHRHADPVSGTTGGVIP